MPQRSFKRNIEAAQKQFEGKLIPNLLTTFSQNRLPKSYRYIRKEMEDTWGSDHLSVLPEDEAQHWILGVGTLFSLLDQEWFLVPSKTPQVLQDHIKRLNTKYKQASCRFPLEFLQLLQSNLANPWCPSPPLFMTIRIEFPPLLQLASLFLLHTLFIIF